MDPVRDADRLAFLTLPRHRQRHLMAEELIEHQPAAGGAHLGQGFGEVDGVDGLLPRNKIMTLDQGGW